MSKVYVRFNRKNQVISLHKTLVKALCSLPVDEGYATAEELPLLANAAKGDTIAGLWDSLQEKREGDFLTMLLVKYKSGEYGLNGSDEKKMAGLMDSLSLRDIAFDEWVAKYSERADAEIEARAQNERKHAERMTLLRANIEQQAEHYHGATFSLPALAGTMGKAIYYAVQIPYVQLVQLFSFNEEHLPTHLRAQRVLNEKRANDIADYILSRRDDYVLPALTASVDTSMSFTPVPGFSNMGTLNIPVSATMLFNDGQHRKAGIEIALKKDPSLRSQSATVVMFYDEGLTRSQQIFADINDKMVKPAKALSILFDKTNKMNTIVVSAIEAAGIKDAIEFEKASVGANSSKVWSISALKKSLEILTGLTDRAAKGLSQEQVTSYTELFTHWLKALVEYTPGALKMEVTKGTIASLQAARENRVVTHAAYLQALATASKQLLLEEPATTFTELEAIKGLPATKGADVWKGRIVNADGTMNPKANGVKLAAMVIMERLGVPVPDAIIELNNQVFGGEAA